MKLALANQNVVPETLWFFRQCRTVLTLSLQIMSEFFKCWGFLIAKAQDSVSRNVNFFPVLFCFAKRKQQLIFFFKFNFN